ncbi:hypothetical protein [Aquirhabdus sp.]|uniref:hypothetical protein n=1 Tax=Aquirhabdus sp. TaxID=2824160 RepID=UPI00396CD3F2
MKTEELNEILACLTRGRTLFHYQKDQHIPLVLKTLIRHGQLQTIADLKQSRYAKWTGHPWVNQFLAQQPNAKATLLPLMDSLLHTETLDFPFILTAGRWGSERQYHWCQTTRRGENLVLHLNLPHSIKTAFEQVGVDTVGQYGFHPHDTIRPTLAWARMDIDLEHGQVLIEEIQSDLIRDIADSIQYALRYQGQMNRQVWLMGNRIHLGQFLAAIKPFYDALYRLWSEAMLTATLHFIFEELGIYDVYYHTWEGGKRLKKLHKYGAPPRSLYSQLPERFGFAATSIGPVMLERDPQVKRRIKAGEGDLRWYRLNV